MATNPSSHASPMAPGRKRRDAQSKHEGKKFTCQHDECGRTFTRAEHLQRHLLNHSNGDYTCDRCRAHFKRKDLLERHMTRHRQKDEEAGADGYGILNTRKRMWKDSEGKIVAKKPALSNDIQGLKHPPPSLNQQSLPPPTIDFLPFPTHQDGAPISPPTSNTSRNHSWDDCGVDFTPGYARATLDLNSLSSSNPYSPDNQRFWSTDLTQTQPDPLPAPDLDDALFDDIFNPDTASSFNNPFTTMSNYNWLFDMDLAKVDQVQQPFMTDSSSACDINNSDAAHPSHVFNLQFGHVTAEKPMSLPGHLGPDPSQHINSPEDQPLPTALISPPLNAERRIPSVHYAVMQSEAQTSDTHAPPGSQAYASQEVFAEIERPMSMLQPSRSLPLIEELARAQLLDLIDITQPTAPDGSIVMRDHPLLTLACLQTYCDLFFTRFNTVYPLIHMSTFIPSEVETLLLISVLLLGATYGEKNAHQLAVCIHDNIRPQIFASAGFSAKPDLWVLQTILLVECFGKSRAGQKQHDMSHLFHGLLINLIRRSGCQSVRLPTPEDATDDIDEDWRTWCEAEQRKRLAFLCFMWDTQHAVLFCQSLCFSAFELRSTLPCDQSLWEADSAETWHQLRKRLPATPLFLSCLKVYLQPNTATVPRNLNALSRSLLLHGLMSVAWDMQRRDQTSLGVIEANPLGNWQARLAVSYDIWHKDYQAFCTHYNSQLPQSDHLLAKEFKVHCAAILSLYHSAHILLYTPSLDLQIYAGTRHILGRSVARHDYARSQRVVKTWVTENPREASKAVWHASSLLTDGIDIPECELGSNDLGSGRLWHHPWAIYLATLVIWGVWYAQPAPTSSEQIPRFQDDEDDIIWDPSTEMKILLRTIMKSDPETLLEHGGIVGEMGKRGTNGLAAVVSRCLSKVRWAVVHDGMMVLRGLVQWRLVGGGTPGGL